MGEIVRVFLSAKGKLKIVTSAKHTATEKAFEEWEQDNYLVTTQLWNNMKFTVSANIMFLDIAKEFWEAVHDTYSMMQNASRVFEVCGIYLVSDNFRRLL